MKKKSLALAAIAVLMVASLATAVTLAYFTDTKTATNTFTVGNVKIELAETAWTDNSKINPNQPVTKNPVVKNVGANDAYARIKVTVNKADVFGSTPEAIKTAVANIFSTGNNGAAGSLGDEWTLDTIASDYDANDKTLTLVYNYSDKLAAKDGNTVAGTSELFQFVTLPAAFNNTQMAALSGFTITVKAEAIQADTFADASAAFTALNSQTATDANP